jgi:hypothetical protein
MSTTTPCAPAAQASPENKPRPRLFRIPRRPAIPYELSPHRIAARQRRVRIERAVNLIGRTKCGTKVAARAVGLRSRDEMQELYDALDDRKIPRKRKWGGPLRVPHTLECCEAYVEPRTRPAPLRPGREWQVLDEYDAEEKNG